MKEYEKRVKEKEGESNKIDNEGERNRDTCIHDWHYGPANSLSLSHTDTHTHSISLSHTHMQKCISLFRGSLAFSHNP